MTRYDPVSNPIIFFLYIHSAAAVRRSSSIEGIYYTFAQFFIMIHIRFIIVHYNRYTYCFQYRETEKIPQKNYIVFLRIPILAALS